MEAVEKSPETTPIIRIEKYLSDIASERVSTLLPVTRIETYLAKISGADVPIPAPVTRIEKYLAAIAGEDIETPIPVTRLEYFLADWAAAGGASLETVTGNAPVTLLNAVAKAIVSLTQTGLCTQASTPTPSSPVDIKCNNGALKMVDDELPSAYRRVLGFTCNNNAMWQITGFKLKGSDTVRISFSVTTACNVFGCYQGTSATDNYDLYASTTSGSKYFRYGNGTYLSYWSSANLGQRFDVVYTPTGSQGMPDDSTWTEMTFESANDLLLGSTTTTGTSSKLKGNLYGDFIVENGGVERLHLVPCERLSDNVLGYYDLVGETFYEPYEGFEGAVSLGYDGSHYVLRTVGTAEVISLSVAYDDRLPNGYTPLEYVSSSGANEFINTGIVLNSFDLDVECTVQYTDNATSTPKMAWAFMGPSSNLPRWGIGGYTSKWLASVNNTTSAGSFDQNKHTFVLSVFDDNGTPKYNATIDGDALYPAATSVQNVNLFEANDIPLYLFARNNNGTAGNFASCKIYGFKVTKGGIVTHELIPAMDADMNVGFYDLNTQTFLTNGGETAFGYNGKYVEYATASVVNLLSVDTYKDTQEIISGAVTRKVGVKVLDGTEAFTTVSNGYYLNSLVLNTPKLKCTHFGNSGTPRIGTQAKAGGGYFVKFIVDTEEEYPTPSSFKAWLAAQYAAGTPVIFLYVLPEATTESVAGQALSTAAGTNVVSVTAEVSPIALEVEYYAKSA